MPFSVSVEDGSGLLVACAEGSLGDGEVFELIELLLADRSVPDGVDGLVDLRAVDRLDLSAEAVRRASEIATEHESRFAGSRWGIVASRDLVFGISRMYELQRNPQRYDIAVFRDIETARAWLLEPGTTEDPAPGS